MKKLISTVGLSRNEWLRVKKQGLGGSEIGAVLGYSRWAGPIDIYVSKISDEIIEKEETESLRQGKDLEEYVARRFCEATGKRVRRLNAIIYNEKKPWMIGDVDRMIVGENAGLEIKTASPYVESEWNKDKIPLSYQMQCFHYMSITGADAWYVAVLIYGREFKYYRIERDEAIISSLIKLEEDFWLNHVQKRVMPDPDGSKLADSVIASYCVKSTDKVIPLLGFDEKLKRREELIALLEKMETEKRMIEQELKLYMGEAEKAENEKFFVSWKSCLTSKLDSKALKEQEPEIYKKFLKTSHTRRFLVKTA